eukprot:GHVL01032979.1.p1 GENE.GHVL01032979.1~~GHVL01032979.1.p1  ORF type:complete len:377 (+),score=51.83 GHVL01032979.1:58-1188(+)
MGQTSCPGMLPLFPQSFDDRYHIGDHLGTGRFAEVYVCFDRANDNKKYAIKVMQAREGHILTRIREEIAILKDLRGHKGVVTLIDSHEQELANGGYEVRVVLELCDGGELYDKVQNNSVYSEEDCRILIRNLLETIAFIHSKGIMHRDIKPENILLSSKTDPTSVKLSDFGLARRSTRNALPRSRSICGSDFYLAPEVIKHEEYGREIDIWSVGVVTYVSLSGSLPFFHNILHKLYRQIVERDISFPAAQWGGISRGGQDFILRLLQNSPNDRLTAEQALQHPWLRSIGTHTTSRGFKQLENMYGKPMPAPPTGPSTGPSQPHRLQHARAVGADQMDMSYKIAPSQSSVLGPPQPAFQRQQPAIPGILRQQPPRAF